MKMKNDGTVHYNEATLLTVPLTPDVMGNCAPLMLRSNCILTYCVVSLLHDGKNSLIICFPSCCSSHKASIIAAIIQKIQIVFRARAPTQQCSLFQASTQF